MSNKDTKGQKLYETLRGVAFLRGVSDEQVRDVAAIGRLVHVPKGEFLFREADPGVNCYLVIEGIISLEFCSPSAGCATILTIGEGELLSWSPLLGHEKLTASARTLTDVRMIELNAERLLELCKKNPEFGYKFMRCTSLALAKRLTATRLQLLDLYRSESPRNVISGENRG